jgi:hypothetical protein
MIQLPQTVQLQIPLQVLTVQANNQLLLIQHLRNLLIPHQAILLILLLLIQHQQIPHLQTPHLQTPHQQIPHQQIPHQLTLHQLTLHRQTPHQQILHQLTLHQQTLHQLILHLLIPHLLIPHQQNLGQQIPHLYLQSILFKILLLNQQSQQRSQLNQ